MRGQQPHTSDFSSALATPGVLCLRWLFNLAWRLLFVMNPFGFGLFLSVVGVFLRMEEGPGLVLSMDFLPTSSGPVPVLVC